jgi:hypothetical protein
VTSLGARGLGQAEDVVSDGQVQGDVAIRGDAGLTKVRFKLGKRVGTSGTGVPA